ncbi:Hypothetical protein BN2458_PEG2025 [Helicobacter typhlonius]|uniref:Uncharacterized protein n=1 Tax=Helicobacter typhlonius TaxID=76936 RepID=A0A0S4PY17_9HELI|nr:Hypothetical protein BN2458_PEG2025 [Helicobacter typhlonius]
MPRLSFYREVKFLKSSYEMVNPKNSHIESRLLTKIED